MPTVYVRDYNHRRVTVACPFSSSCDRIPRDPAAWITHMNADHSADADSWADTTDRGGQEGFADEYPTLYRFGFKCYGCGATFETAALLKTHLETDHSASA